MHERLERTKMSVLVLSVELIKWEQERLERMKMSVLVLSVELINWDRKDWKE